MRSEASGGPIKKFASSFTDSSAIARMRSGAVCTTEVHRARMIEPIPGVAAPKSADATIRSSASGAKSATAEIITAPAAITTEVRKSIGRCPRSSAARPINVAPTAFAMEKAPAAAPPTAYDPSGPLPIAIRPIGTIEIGERAISPPIVVTTAPGRDSTSANGNVRLALLARDRVTANT